MTGGWADPSPVIYLSIHLISYQISPPHRRREVRHQEVRVQVHHARPRPRIHDRPHQQRPLPLSSYFWHDRAHLALSRTGGVVVVVAWARSESGVFYIA